METSQRCFLQSQLLEPPRRGLNCISDLKPPRPTSPRTRKSNNAPQRLRICSSAVCSRQATSPIVILEPHLATSNTRICAERAAQRIGTIVSLVGASRIFWRVVPKRYRSTCQQILTSEIQTATVRSTGSMCRDRESETQPPRDPSTNRSTFQERANRGKDGRLVERALVARIALNCRQTHLPRTGRRTRTSETAGGEGDRFVPFPSSGIRSTNLPKARRSR